MVVQMERAALRGTPAQHRTQGFQLTGAALMASNSFRIEMRLLCSAMA